MPRAVRIDPGDHVDATVAKELQREVDTLYVKLLSRGEIFKDDDEQSFYKDRLRAYLKDFIGLNTSSDFDVLFNMLVEMIQQRRILISCQEVGRPLPEAYTESQQRWHKLMMSLSVRRIDRKKLPDKEEDIRQVFNEIFANNIDALAETDKSLMQEEEKFSQEKQEREQSLGIIHGN